MTATRRYIRIEPAHERVTPSDIISRLAGLRKLKSGWKIKYDPRKSAPTFEFLALTQGNQTPVRFYLGAVDETLLSTVCSELTTAYPASYNLSEEELALPDELLEPSTVSIDTDGDEDTVKYQSSDDVRSELLNRTPIAARWQGVGTRSDDWMTPLTQYSQFHATHHGDSVSAKAPLATAVERLAQASAPTVLQVLFTRYADWEKLATTRKENIQTKHDGVVQSAKTASMICSGAMTRSIFAIDGVDETPPNRGEYPPDIKRHEWWGCLSTSAHRPEKPFPNVSGKHACSWGSIRWRRRYHDQQSTE
ncbi:hypothetical protein ACFFQF_30240 [Haladaptatus pallidirubidus]|uniref:hypothetical protein n=1 Tax=Haladaptatus pallidirubidus TaxID=1008152 RepID=UPI0035E6E67F